MSDYPDSFPLADLAQEYVENQTNFFDCRDTGVYLIGFGNGDELYHFDSSGLLQYPFPFTYGDVYDYEKSYTIQDIDTYRNYHIVGEAWGTIATPFGTFECLKNTNVETEEATAMGITSTSTSYQVTYWSPAVGNVLFVVEYEISFSGIDFTYITGAYLIDNNKSSTNIIDSNVFETIKVYPNPSSEHVLIDIDNANNRSLDVDVYSLNGKYINQSSLIGEEYQNNSIKLSISSLPIGNYVIILKSENEIVGKAKFSFEKKVSSIH
jgi:hypothetical protein